MNRLLLRLLFIAGLLVFCGAGFSKKPAPPAPKQGQLYYWYTWPYDTYNDRKTLNDEIFELWVLYGVHIDTSPFGGTIIMRGYFNDAYPHNQLPQVFLYAHWPW